MLPTEAATVANATVLTGGFLAAGVGCTVTGTLTINGGQALLINAPNNPINAVLGQYGARIVVSSIGGAVYPSITLKSGSTATWLSDASITTLVLQTGSVFDKSADARPIGVTNSTQDGDTTIVRDPQNAISWLNPITFTNAALSGPVQLGPGRTWKIT